VNSDATPMVYIPNPYIKTEPQVFPKIDKIINCKNHQYGCPQTGTFTKLIYHQHICTYVPYKTRKNKDTYIKTHYAKGYIDRDHSKDGTHYAFNNSFLRLLGTQLYFSRQSNRLIFHSYTNKTGLDFSPKNLHVNLKVYLENNVLNMKISETPKCYVLPEKNTMLSKAIKYKLVVTYIQPPVCID